MYLRGIVASKVDLERSDSSRFLIDGNGKILPPFRALDFVSDVNSVSIYEEVRKLPFISIAKDLNIQLNAISKSAIFAIPPNEHRKILLFHNKKNRNSIIPVLFSN